MKKIIGNILFYSICLLLLLILVSQLGFLPFRIMYVSTGSMVPTFYPGDLAVVQMSPNLEIKSGDIILFYTGSERVLHRAVQVENGLITTQGDANDSPDTRKLDRADGKLLFTLPKLGYPIAWFQNIISGRAPQ